MKEKIKSIYILWQDIESRRQFPVGHLEYIYNDHESYQFCYIQGVTNAISHGFQPFPGFPELESTYVSSELFPFFQNRILQPSREEYDAFVKSLGLSPYGAKPIDILARSGGRRATDTIEVFAPAEIIECAEEDYNIARYYFLLHGLSHMKECAQDLVTDLVKEDDQVFVMHDIQNHADENALLLRTHDYCSIGFIPRYLLGDMWINNLLHKDLVFSIYKINKPPSPIQQRIVCKAEAKVTKDFVSCSSKIYNAYRKTAKV